SDLRAPSVAPLLANAPCHRRPPCPIALKPWWLLSSVPARAPRGNRWQEPLCRPPFAGQEEGHRDGGGEDEQQRRRRSLDVVRLADRAPDAGGEGAKAQGAQEQRRGQLLHGCEK